jgi:hypothetical protein
MLPYARAGPPPHLSEAIAHAFQHDSELGLLNRSALLPNDSFILKTFPDANDQKLLLRKNKLSQMIGNVTCSIQEHTQFISRRFPGKIFIGHSSMSSQPIRC